MLGSDETALDFRYGLQQIRGICFGIKFGVEYDSPSRTLSRTLNINYMHTNTVWVSHMLIEDKGLLLRSLLPFK